MIRKSRFAVILFFLFTLGAAAAWPVEASPQKFQAYYETPTALPDGRIFYVVQPGDSCIAIELKTGVKVDELRRLNALDENCNVMAGQKLLLGVITQPTDTPGPSPTPVPATVTPTPFPGSGTLCIYLFNDVNGNALAEDTETAIAGGAISITNKSGAISLTNNTDLVTVPTCFTDVPEGDYNISVGAPAGYNPTTSMNYSLAIKAGDSSTLDFGVQTSGQGQPAAAAPVETGGGGGSSLLLALVGGLLLLGGIGLGLYMFLGMRRNSRGPKF